MSDQKKEVLFRIRIDEEATKKRMVDLAKQIENNKRVQAELSKEMKAGGVVTDEMIVRQQALKLEYEALSKELKTQTQVLTAQQNVDNERLSKLDQLRAQSVLLAAAWNDLTDEEKANAEVGGQLAKKINEVNVAIKNESATLKNNKQVTEYAEGSVYALREAYGDLQDQYYSLSEAERKGKVGQQLQKDIMALHEEITKAEQSVGVFSRNVGNYTTSVLEAIDGSGKLNGAIELMKQGYEKLSGIVDSVKESVMEEAKAKIAAKAATDGVTTATNINKAAIIGNVAALKLLKYALVATGIGAILLLLGGLISFLTRTQEGIDKVSRVTKGLTTTLGWLTDQLSAVGKRVWDFVSGFENLGDAVKKLGQLLLDNLISRLKGFLVIWEAVKSGDMTKLQDGIWQVGTGITDATAKTKAFAKEMAEVAKAGAAIEAENQRIRDAEMELNKERAKSRAEIERLKMLSDDTNKSLQERTEAARKAGEMERALLAREIELQQRKVENIKAEQALTDNLAEDNQKLAEEEAKLYELQEASLTRQTELQNKLLALRKEGADKAARAKELSEKEYAALQRRLADEKAALEIQVLQSKEFSDERLEAEIELARKEMEIALTAKDLTENQKKLIQAKFDSDELKARKEHSLKLVELAQQEAERLKEIKEKNYNEQQARTAAAFAELTLLETQRYLDGQSSEQEYQSTLNSIRLKALEKQLSDAIIAGQSTTAIEQAIADERIAIRQQEAATKQTIAETEYQTAVMMVQAMADLAVIVANQSTDASEFAKAVTLFQLGIDTARALSAITASSAQVAASIAAASGPAGIVTGPAAYASYYATNVAALLANIAQAKQLLAAEAPQPKGFAEGGYTGNGYGTPDASGYRVAGVVHEHEYVVPKWQVKQNAGIIAALERQRLKGYATGGYASSSLPPSVRSAFAGAPVPTMDYNQLAQALSKMPAPVNRWQDFQKIQNQQARASQFKDI